MKDKLDKKKKRSSTHPDFIFHLGGGAVIIEKDSTAPGFSCCAEVSVLCFY